MGGLLDLPAELHLQIGAHLVGDAKDILHVRHLSNLALTCRQLALIAQEALCLSPVLQSSKVDSLLLFLFNHHNLVMKIKNLTIETRETQYREGHPKRIAHLDPELLNHCKRHVRKLPVRKCIRDNMVALLKRGRFENHSVLLTVLLTLLPNLTQLYLGGSILLNFPFLRTLFPISSNSTSTSDWPDNTDYTWLLSLIGPQLTALELPLDLRPSVDAHSWAPLSIHALPTHFPNLRWLSVPHMAATTMSHTSCADIISPRLETLILTDARCGCFEVLSRGLLSPSPSLASPNPFPFPSGNGNNNEQTSLFPRLRTVQIYHRYKTEPTDRQVVEKLKKAGIELSDYVPECCLRSGDEFFHPWKYTSEEVTAREDARHEAYVTEWEMDAEESGSDGEW